MMYSKLIQFKPDNKWDWRLDAAMKVEQVDAPPVKFVLRDDVGFTDDFGTMTAEDVKFSFECIVNDPIDASVSRVRPVMMAVLTSIPSMIPLMLNAFFASMAVTIIFGLGFASIVPLIVLPVLYSIFYRVWPAPQQMTQP